MTNYGCISCLKTISDGEKVYMLSGSSYCMGCIIAKSDKKK